MRQLTKFRLHPRLIGAIRRSPENLAAIGAPGGLRQADISTYLHGGTFGVRRRDRVLLMGAALGVPADRCTRRAR